MEEGGLLILLFLLLLFILLYYVSASAYRLLQNNLPIPAESTIHLHVQKFFYDNSYSIVDLYDLPSLLKAYKNHINASNTSNIEGTIAVDAVSLYSNHKLDTNTISGFINFDSLTIENYEEIRHSYSNLENFISNHSNQTTKSAFIFRFHPININYSVFVIHLYPWTLGKANEKIEQRIFTLGKLMDKNLFNIIGYSFDSDSSYRHNLEKIDKNFDYSIGIKYSKINQPLFFSDYPHIFQRARYRLLKRINFSNKGNEIKKSWRSHIICHI